MSRPASKRHKARRIRHGGVSADVNEQIADLVLAMWRAGIRTEASCQDVGHCGVGRGNLAEITLSRDDLERLRRTIGPDASELLIESFHGSSNDPAARHQIRFKLVDVPALQP